MNSIFSPVRVFVTNALVGKIMFVRAITGPLMVSFNNILEKKKVSHGLINWLES